MKDNKIIRRLKSLLEEVEEDIQYEGESTAVCVFYEELDCVDYFTDYEIASADYNEYIENVEDSDEKKAVMEKVEQARAFGTDYELYNIIYDGENYILTSLATLRKTLLEFIDGADSSTIEDKRLHLK